MAIPQGPKMPIPPKTLPNAAPSPPTVRNLSTVQNTGSTARDHLANERTFLSWVRSGLGFVGLGTALFAAFEANSLQQSTHYSLNRHNLIVPTPPPPRHSKASNSSITVLPASLLLWGNGSVILGYALYRYRSVQKALLRGEFIIAKGGVVGVTVSTGLTCLGVVLWLLVMGEDV